LISGVRDVKRYSAVIVPLDFEQTPFRVTVTAESESEARRILEEEHGKNSVHALQEQLSRPPPRPSTW
jgi:hypothetical protein